MAEYTEGLLNKYMKTALVSTDFWDEEEFIKLHVATKFIYTTIMLSKNDLNDLSDIELYNILSIRTGFSKEQLETGIHELKDAGLSKESKI